MKIFNDHKFGSHFLGFLVLSVYFSLFFTAISYLRFSILQKNNIPYSNFGFGVIRALICAKFMLLAKAFYPIKITPDKALVWHILNRTFIYLLVVIILTLIEEGLVARIHGKIILNSIIGWAPGTMNQFFAMSIIYWLMLVPYVSYQAVSQALGDKILFNLLFRNTNSKSKI